MQPTTKQNTQELTRLAHPALTGVLERSANAGPVNICSRQPNKMHKSLPGLPIPPLPGVLERSANARPVDTCSRQPNKMHKSLPGLPTLRLPASSSDLQMQDPLIYAADNQTKYTRAYPACPPRPYRRPRAICKCKTR